MRNIADALRQARSEVIPLVPELAPLLPTERDTSGLDVIQEELADAIAGQGVDPGTISAPDFNKLSRHTLAGGVIRLQRQHLIEGEGSEARFTLDALDEAHFRKRWQYFMPELSALQDVGARYVQSTYSAGRDTEHSWFPLLRHRHKELGKLALDITPRGSPPNPRFPQRPFDSAIPVEGRSIAEAMKTRALGGGVVGVCTLVRRKFSGGEPANRVQAAHDIAPQLIGGIASSHLYEMAIPRPLRSFNGEIVMNPKTGRYRFKQTPEYRRKLFPHLPDDELPNARMKCAAHAAVETGDTDMMYFVHAAINLAAGHYSRMLQKR